MITDGILSSFNYLFGFTSFPTIVRSPGRVNIIGEHTDYNDGFVLPAAIDKSVYVAISKRKDDVINLFSVAYKENYTTALSDIIPTNNWCTYILGVVDQLMKRGYTFSGFNLAIDGDIPIGAGLSSSAAVECATVFALNKIFEFGIDKMEMVRIAQKAEQEFAGVMCGIMDQFASMFGKKDYAIKLDCRSLQYEYIPLRLDGYKIVLLDTKIKHSLASSEYNTRRLQCEQGVAWVKDHHPGINTLRDVNIEMLYEYVLPKDKLIFKRCKYVVEENHRLIGGCEALQQGNLAFLGQRMFETHAALSTEYEVSCLELDLLVRAVTGNPNVLGARMMGGGFGGCTINLVKEEGIEKLYANTAKIYKVVTGLELCAYIAHTGNGTEIINVKK